MTTINNDNFTIKEKNMTTEEIEKKAPAKKAPAKKRIDNDAEDYSYETEREAIAVDERAEAIDNAITTLQRNADAQKQLISSVNDKNDTLQDKLNIIDTDNIKVVIPSYILEEAINSAIIKVNNQLINSLDEANDTLAELGKVEMIHKLDNVELIDKMTERVDDLENTIENSNIDDLDYEIENAVQNELSNCYYVEESDVERMIDDRLDDVVTREDIDNDLKIYGREINELKARLDNTLLKKITKVIKRMFSYNLSNKVRSIFKRNKKEVNAHDELAKAYDNKKI